MNNINNKEDLLREIAETLSYHYTDFTTLPEIWRDSKNHIKQAQNILKIIEKNLEVLAPTTKPEVE